MDYNALYLSGKYQILVGLCYFLIPVIKYNFWQNEEKPLFIKGLNKFDGANGNCSYPLINICQTMKDAVECKATPYCIQCIWSTSFLDMTSLKCQTCQSSVDAAKANFTDERIYAKLLRHICELHILIDDQQACLQNIEFYLSNKDVFWSVDPLNISTLDTCSLLGMCYSPFKVTLPPETANSLFRQEYWKGAKNFILNEEMEDVYGAKIAQINSEIDAQAFVPIFNPNVQTDNFSKYSCQFIEKNGPFRLNPLFLNLTTLMSLHMVVLLIRVLGFPKLPKFALNLYCWLKRKFLALPIPFFANANVVNVVDPIVQAE